MKKKYLSILLILALALSGVVPTFAKTKVKIDEERLAGPNRYETSLAVTEHLYKEKGVFDSIILASGTNFPDALSGGYLSKKTNAPLLLVSKEQEANIKKSLGKYLKKNGTIYLLGGKGVISETFEKGISKTYSVKRLAGPSRYDTNLEILKATVKKGDALLVASGTGFADSLSGSSVGNGMLLVGDELKQEQETWLRSMGISKFYILGGTGAVSDKVEKELERIAKVERIGGKTRYETSAKIAKRFFPNATTITLACGTNFPDGLSGSPIAMHHNAPIVLVSNNQNSYSDAHKYVVNLKITNVLIIGGTGVIGNITARAVMEQFVDEHKHNWKNTTKTVHHDAVYEDVWVEDAPEKTVRVQHAYWYYWQWDMGGMKQTVYIEPDGTFNHRNHGKPESAVFEIIDGEYQVPAQMSGGSLVPTVVLNTSTEEVWKSLGDLIGPPSRSSTIEDAGEKTIPATGHYENRLAKKAYDEIVVTGRKCTICGKTESN